jgi:hypothetical protein
MQIFDEEKKMAIKNRLSAKKVTFCNEEKIKEQLDDVSLL